MTECGESITIRVSVSAIGDRAHGRLYELGIDAWNNEKEAEYREVLRDLCDRIGTDIFDYLIAARKEDFNGEARQD